MRILILLALVPSLALADALPASSGAALAMAAGPQAQVSASLGTTGATFARSENDRIAFASFDWRSAALEAGAGGLLFRKSRYLGWWSMSGFVSPIGGWTVGARGIAGVSALFVGDRFLLRPAMTASLGVAGGPGQSHLSALAPVEVSVDLGWRGAGSIPFVRASAGIGSIAESQWKARGALAVGVVMPW